MNVKPCCDVVRNNQVLINEAHTNNYIFVLEYVPTTFLVSAFSNDTLTKVSASLSQVTNPDAIREMNNDVVNLALYLQSFTLPDITLGIDKISTQFAPVPVATGRIDYSDLITNFMNDENYFIWRFFYYWFVAGSNPENRNQRSSARHFIDFNINGYLIVLDNHRDKILEMKFHDLHPRSMGSVDLKDTDPEKVIMPITWAYSDFYPTDDMVIERV